MFSMNSIRLPNIIPQLFVLAVRYPAGAMSRVSTEDTKRYSDAFILFNKSGNGVLTPEEFRKV